jgi:hypothetical protein
MLGDDHLSVFSLLGDVINQKAENRQMLVLRPEMMHKRQMLR